MNRSRGSRAVWQWTIFLASSVMSDVRWIKNDSNAKVLVGASGFAVADLLPASGLGRAANESLQPVASYNAADAEDRF